ncbi:MAG: response regulator [Desulfobacterales bacterium]|nr:response regulator [Desulfobacterales bacterium]
MVDSLTAISVFLLYIGCLFLIALWAERKAVQGRSLVNNPFIYSLSLAVYCTTWTYYGSVGNAARCGMLFLTYFLGPTIAITLWWTVLRKLVRIKSIHRITSISDFISARYDKSEGLAAIATFIALMGLMPYIALQLKAIHFTFDIITHPDKSTVSWLGTHFDSIVVGLMILFTIIFGVRRLDPTERHEGMVMVLAVECLVKLLGLFAAGIFVTYFVYDGFLDIFQRLNESPFKRLMNIGGTEGCSYLIWMTYLILSMSAILFLPRQFHVAVVENTNEKHILTSMWLLPLYLLLINIFVFPIAAGGVLKGFPIGEADRFVLLLPIEQGKNWMAMLVFIGGFSAATGMIMISSMTLSTMITNHLFLPVIRWIRWLSFLQRHLLKCKWAAVAVVILFGYWFEQQVDQSFMLVNIGMISFAAVIQFAPVILGGIFWERGGKIGAFLGLCVGFLIWFYTLLLPSFLKSLQAHSSLLENGPWGIEFLKPENLFGLTIFDPLSHTVFWTMVFNIGLYVLGSLYFKQTREQRSSANEFVSILSSIPVVGQPAHAESYIELVKKKSCIENLLSQYFSASDVKTTMDKCCRAVGVEDKSHISVVELVRLHNEVEKSLAGSIGAAAAHKTMSRGACFTAKETQDLMEVYREVFAKLRVTPEELHAKIDYYREKEELLTNHAKELEYLNQMLELRIIEQEEAEKALGESEKKYRSIFENSPYGIFQSTPQGRFVSVSPSMARILGYHCTDELKELVTDIENQLYVDPQQRKKLLRLLQENDIIRDFECKFYRKDGSSIWISIQARAIRDLHGNLLFIEGFNQDISERKKAEEELQKANKELEDRVEQRTHELQITNRELQKTKEAAEAATESKSEFLANMSHEIRTPMNGVIAAADLALGEELPLKTKHYLEIIHSSAYSLLGLINDILDFSKIEAGKLDLEIQPFRLDQVFDRVVDMFINRTAEKRIELLIDIDLETPKALIGDSLRLQQILINLLSNAVKFTEKGGVILVGAKDTEKSEDHIILKCFVKDTGVGIASENLTKIFECFSQVDASTTRKYEGTGLGLCICRRLLDLMGGSIWAESELGKGSTFYFTVSFKRQPKEEEQKLIPPLDIQGLNILVVDDCDDSRIIMQKILESFGFRVEAVSAGLKAIERLKEKKIRQEPFDLVLIDWMMPDIDGIETSKKIREDLKFTLPIILMTAFGKESEMLDAEKVGINAFLTKPIYPSTLFDAIMDAFGKEALKSARKEDRITTIASLYKNRLRGMRILVAEDNLTNQEIAVAILEGAGIIAEIAKNGKEAVEAVQKQQFDAVLMDIQMPEMDGYEATRVIRNDPQFASLPIIAMTAHAMKGDEEKCLEAGMDGYISKPISQDRLFHTIWKSIKSQKRSAPPEELPESDAITEKSHRRNIMTEDLPLKLPGINIQDALKALNIEKYIFKRILLGFLRNNKDTIDKIQAAAAANDWETLRLSAHSIKGSAANIGADELQKAAQALEKACTDAPTKTPDSQLIDVVIIALNKVLESLQTLTDTEAIESRYVQEKSVDSAQFLKQLEALSDALEHADPEEITKNMEILKEHFDRTILQDLENQIDAYDYDEALTTLKKIEKNSKIKLL